MKTDDLALVAVVVAALFWPQLKGLLPGGVVPGPGPAPSGPVFVPNEKERNAVQGVISTLGGDRVLKEKFAVYFDMLGRAIDVAPEHFRTVGDMNNHQYTAGALYAKEIPGGAKGFGEAVAAAYHEMLGDDNKSITQNEALMAAQSLEWACNQ